MCLKMKVKRCRFLMNLQSSLCRWLPSWLLLTFPLGAISGAHLRGQAALEKINFLETRKFIRVEKSSAVCTWRNPHTIYFSISRGYNTICTYIRTPLQNQQLRCECRLQLDFNWKSKLINFPYAARSLRWSLSIDQSCVYTHCNKVQTRLKNRSNCRCAQQKDRRWQTAAGTREKYLVITRPTHTCCSCGCSDFRAAPRDQ